MRTKPPVQIEVITERPRPTKREQDTITKGAQFQAYEPPANKPINKSFWKVYRTLKTGNKDPRPILIPKKDCKIIG